ncbi:MAG: hypothetical protein MJA84_10055 [Firmicutes bacterium]|nr:hypothetical protein [Bacillota bacterium]
MSKGTPNSLCEALQNRQNLGEWLEWLRDSGSEAAINTRRFLNYAVDCLTIGEKQKFLKKIKRNKKTSSSDQIFETIFELVAHQFFKQFEIQCDYEPKIDGKTPDLTCQISGIEYVIDVFVTYSPSKTVKNVGPGLISSLDTDKPDESRSKKIADKIEEKVKNYTVLKRPILLFIGLGDNNILSIDSIEQALYGIHISEYLEKHHFPKDFHFEKRRGRCLLSPGLEPMHKELSAVIVCDWFDTLNSHDRGKRLNSVVLHHFDPLQPLPPQVFSPFQDVCWKKTGERNWVPSTYSERNWVAKFTEANTFAFGRYTADEPW